jgi:ANTAR domain/GAF domain
MDSRPTGHIDQSAKSLADLRLEGQTIDSIVGTIGRLAVESLKGWDAAATSLVTGDEVATYGCTDDRINPVDQAQYDAGRGPCVDAIKTGEIQYFDGDSVQPSWRQFAETAADHNVYSVFSFPMRLDEDVIGAINLYSKERDALRPGHREEGSLFAAQAAVAVGNARAYLGKEVQIGHLEDALETRTMIGQATGLLMAQDGLTSDEAFQKLVSVSQNTNIKLREIAQKYVETWGEKTQTSKEG